jgi:hypothetical protein
MDYGTNYVASRDLPNGVDLTKGAPYPIGVESRSTPSSPIPFRHDSKLWVIRDSASMDFGKYRRVD